MAVHLRAGPLPRPDGDAKAVPTSSHPSFAQHHRPVPSAAIDDDNGPPVKRRKLSLRGPPPAEKRQAHRQTTLDAFTTRSAQPKPPTKVTLPQPGGRLLETVNGVRSELDTKEHELGDNGMSARSTSPKKRSPGPAFPPAKPKQKQKQEKKRTLRSQDDGPRLKSELASYFPNFEEIMFDVPKEPDFLTVDSVLYVTDEPPKSREQHPNSSSPSKATKGGKNSPILSLNGSSQLNIPARPSSTVIDLDFASRNLPAAPEDPLTDAHYEKSHKRAERKEKQLRNIEKERAQHEKISLDRLLDQLQGHDWLRALGITGVTDSEAKKFEPKRDYFTSEVRALIDKFRIWKEEEKRLREVREEARRAETEEQEDSPGPSLASFPAESASANSSPAPSSATNDANPPSSDLNASATKQLQRETASALRHQTASPKPQRRLKLHPPAPPPAPASPPPPITSFYPSAHARTAALKPRQTARRVEAFGRPVPEMEEKEFELPPEVLTGDAVRRNARVRRRARRERAGG